MTVQGGSSDAGHGGSISIATGASTSADHASGGLSLSTANATTDDGASGSVNITTGSGGNTAGGITVAAGSSRSDAGGVRVAGGSSASGRGGGVIIAAGDAGDVLGPGWVPREGDWVAGSVHVAAGDAVGDKGGTGGGVTIEAGASQGLALAGGSVVVRSGGSRSSQAAYLPQDPAPAAATGAASFGSASVGGAFGGRGFACCCVLCSWGCVLTVRVLFMSMVMSQIPSTQPPQVTYSCPVVMWRRRVCPAVTWRSPVATRQVLAPAAEPLLCGPAAVQEGPVVVSRCVVVMPRRRPTTVSMGLGVPTHHDSGLT